MTKRTSNFSSVKRVASRTPVVIALCAASLLSACGLILPTTPTGNDSPTAPTQTIDDAHITVTHLLLDNCSGYALEVRGTIQNTGSETIIDDPHFLFLNVVFYNEAGRLNITVDILDPPFAPGEQRRFYTLTEKVRIKRMDVLKVGTRGAAEQQGCRVHRL